MSLTSSSSRHERRSAIQIEGLGKRYTGATGKYRNLTETASDWLRDRLTSRQDRREPATAPFWALQNFTCDVEPGEVLGVIGRNGAGKSTLLKILSRITEPTTGRVILRGRVGSLLEVGTGFHGELSGRENIYLSGAILGMHRQEITRKFDEIVAFAEVERFVDMPVKRYSTGMYLRLAFAVAAHLEPEILLVDEVLAVGDATFQSRCLGRMQQIAGSGRTVLFVSHNLATVRALCTRCLWLDQGRLRADGNPQAVIEQYLAGTSPATRSVDLLHHPGRHPASQTRHLRRLTLLNAEDQETSAVCSGQPLRLRLDFSDEATATRPRIIVIVSDALGTRLFALDSAAAGDSLPLGHQKGSVVCELPALPLQPGRYLLSLSYGDSVRLTEALDHVLTLEVVNGDFFGSGRLPKSEHGPLLVPSRWSCAPRATHPASQVQETWKA